MRFWLDSDLICDFFPVYHHKQTPSNSKLDPMQSPTDSRLTPKKAIKAITDKQAKKTISTSNTAAESQTSVL